MYKTMIRKMIVAKIESYAWEHFENAFFGCVEEVNTQKSGNDIWFTAKYVDNTTTEAYFRGFVTENGVLLVTLVMDNQSINLL